MQVHITDEKDLRYEEAIGSDVAQAQFQETVQTDQVMVDANMEMDQAMPDVHLEEDTVDKFNDQREIPIQYHFVSNKPVGSFADESTREEAIFRAITHMGETSEEAHQLPEMDDDDNDEDEFNFDRFDEFIKNFGNAGDAPGSRRSAEKVNEFTAGDAFCQAFPHIFVLGKGYGRQAGKLNAAQRNHLLLQFTGVAARDRQLLGYIDNAVKRVKTINGVNAHVRNDPKSEAVITDLFNNPERQAELVRARKEPYGPERKKIMQEILPHLRLSGKDTPYGFMENFKMKTQTKEMAKRYSVPSGFLTLSFSDFGNPRSVRATFNVVNQGLLNQSGINTKFPAVFNSDEPEHPYGSSGTEFMDLLQKYSNEVAIQDINLLPPGISRID